MVTATNSFFKNKNREDIKKLVLTCMEFVYNDLGCTKEQVLHSVVHLDEATPHVHCVVVPLVKNLIRELILKDILFLKIIYQS